MRYLSSILLTVLTLSISPCVAQVTPTQTTWDSGAAEGWTWDGNEAHVEFPLTGGVSGGYLEAEDIWNGDMTIYAPSEYLGDYSALNDQAYFTVSFAVFEQGSDIWYKFGRLRLSGVGGEYYVDLGDPPTEGSGWLKYQVALKESSWIQVSGSWGALLSDVQTMSLDIEAGSKVTEKNGVDNFALVSGILSTPRISDIRVNHCGRRDFGWYFIGHDGIEQVDIVFNQGMLEADDITNFSFTGKSGEPTPPVPIFIGYDPTDYTTTLAWDVPVYNQSVTITCHSGQQGIRSAVLDDPLDGEWLFGNPDYPTFPSGDGTVGGDAVFTVYHLMGDINRDRLVNLLDLADMACNWLKGIPGN